MRTLDSAARDVIPSSQAILQHPAVSRFDLDPGLLTVLVRDATECLRSDTPPTREAAVAAIVAAVTAVAETLQLPPRRYINATGLVIHTQWGNAPLARTAEDRLRDATGTSPTGAHAVGDRTKGCERLLVALTGSEAAAVTTQNAASCLLVASALAQGREIICAARDLIEISQGARLRDILEACGARVVPVGAANCVYREDYERALSPQTGAVVRIHAANTATTGYTVHVETGALTEISHKWQLPLIVNLGSGSLVDLRQHGLPPTPTIGGTLREGADLVLASGDKLIGGPQAGIICGRRDLIQRLAGHPIARCCRPGKLTLAALEATLASYASGRAWEEIPVLRLLGASFDQLRHRAEAVARECCGPSLTAEAVPDTIECGGASLPGVRLPTWTVRLSDAARSCDVLHTALLSTGVVARRRDGAAVLDLRSVLPEQLSSLVDAVQVAVAGPAGLDHRVGI